MTDRHFHTLKLTKIIQQTKLASTLELEVPKELKDVFTFKAGQYLTFKIVIADEELRRSYSINSASGLDEPLQVTVKKVKQGKVSNYFVDNLSVGDELEVMPPLGNFVLPKENTPKNFFYAAGSGITPIFGLIKTLLNTDNSTYINLQYGNFEQEQVIFYDEFSELQNMYPQRFELKHHYTNANSMASGKGIFGKLFGNKPKENKQTYEIGDFTSEKLVHMSKEHNDFQSSHHFICGPGQMIPQLEKTLMDLGVSQNYIHHEYFAAAVDQSEAVQTEAVQTESLDKAINGEAKLTVTLDGDTDTFSLAQGETILRASIEEGLSVPYACESGVCSTCKARCVSGDVIMRNNSVLSNDEIEAGFILTCQAEARSREIVVDYDDV